MSEVSATDDDKRGYTIIDAPDEASFREAFDGITPPTAYFETPLGRTACYEMKGDAETVDYIVIVHGVCTPAVGMYNLAQEILKIRPSSSIMLYDVWGHGLSSTPATPHRVGIFIDQLWHLLQHCKIDRIHLAGYSLGGIISTAFTALHSKRVQSLTVIAPAGLIRLNEMSDKIQAAVLNKDPEHVNDDSVKQTIFVDFLEGGKDMVIPTDWRDQIRSGRVVSSALQVWEINNHRGHEKSVLSVVHHGNIFDSDHIFVEASKTGVPTLGITGEKDRMIVDVERLQKVGFHRNTELLDADHALVRDPRMIPQIAGIFDTFLSEIS